MAQEGLSFRQQLASVRETVQQMEKRREVERRLEQERNEQALGKKLKEDTAEALAGRYADIHKRFDRDARKFYPLPLLEAVSKEIQDFTDRLKFYADCMTSFPKVFTPNHKSGIPVILADLDGLRKGLDRQLGQWREIQAVLDKVQFRPQQPADGPALVAAAKSFSDRAHKVPLSIPNDYFAREAKSFWVVEAEGKVLGYVKFLPADKTVAFALAPAETVNFAKFARGVLYKFFTQGPLSEKPAAVRVNIAFVREVKFFTDLGFVRAETKGPTEWVYQRELA